MKLHEISVKRPVAVTMIVLIFVVIGVYSLSMLKMEAMPDMDLSMTIVSTTYRNVGSEEIENLITKPIEGAVSSVSGVDTITSQSSEGSSLVMVQFSNGTDMDEAVSGMEGNIDMISAMLPEDADEPMVIKMDTSMMATAMMSVSYEGYDMVQTKKYVDDNVVSRLEAISGVASVNVSGAQDRVIEVVVDPEKMFGYDMNMSSLVGAVSAQNQNTSSGTIEGMNKKMSVRTLGKFKDLKDIEVVPINTSTGEIIYLRDIATVKDTYSDKSTYARLNGVDSLSITISAESDANTVDVVDAITKVLDDLHAENPKFTYNMTMEQASYIKEAISSVANNAVTGGLLAIVILLLFLGSIKNSLIIGVTMPVSIVVTFIGIFFSGMTLNVVSLGGLALGVGMLVDNAVVVLENIFRRRNDLKEGSKEASIKGSGEVVGAVIASVLTTCIVYVPILFIDNIMAIMFKQLAFTIIFSQIASLITTFLLIPMLSSKIKDTGERNKKLSFILEPFNKLINFLYGIYEKSLRWALSHRKTLIIVVLAAFAASIVKFAMSGMTLMEMTDEGTLTVDIELPQGSRLEETNKITEEIEDIIAQHDDVETIFSSVGSSGMLGNGSSNSASVTVTLNDDRKNTTNEVVNELRNMLSDVTGATIELASSNSAMSISSDELSLQFSGSNEEALTDYVKQVESLLSTVDGVAEVSTSIAETKPEVRINVDSAKAASYGMTTSSVSQLVKYAIDGVTASKYTDNGSEYDIDIVYPEDYVKDYNAIKDLRIKTTTGQWIALSDVADVTVEQGSTTLTRVDQQRVLTVTAKLYGTDMSTANRDLERLLKDIPMPDGVAKSAGGSYEMMIEAMQSLLIAILLGILLMYMVMAAQFENISQPLIILGTIPLALIGVELSLIIFNSTFSVVSCIGVLMLMGIIVNNAIVLIDFINTTRKENPDLSRTEAVVFSGKTRMRPILMTSLTSILGFLPMAVSTANGAEMMRPMAIVLLGGLLVGTLLTLFFIPVLYTIFDDHKIKKVRRKERKLKKEQNKNLNI